MSKLKIMVVIGSTREGRFADKPAHFIADFLNQDPRVDAELVDLRDWPLPFFDQAKSPSRVTDGDYGNALANEWAKKIASADGFVMTAAEYNHGYTAVLKNAIDWLGVEWRRKPITFIGYGNAGGARAVEQLRQVAIEMQLVPMKVEGAVLDPAAEPPCPACGTAAPLVEGACSDCGLQLDN